MGKTGGGSGSNQYGPHGTPKRHLTPIHGKPEISLRLTHGSASPDEWSAEEMDLALDADTSGFVPKGTDRALWRFTNRRTTLIFNELHFEKNTYTEPQIQTLLNERLTPGGKTEQETEQVIALSEATDLLLHDVQDGTFSLSADESSKLNKAAAAADSIEPGVIRGTGTVNGEGTVNVQGDIFHAVTSEETLSAFTHGITRIRLIEDPIRRATTYAAFATYCQPYLDGNKRTARLMMNGELMLHGYDAIVIPADREHDYVTAVSETFRTGRVQPYASFLLSCATV